MGTEQKKIAWLVVFFWVQYLCNNIDLRFFHQADYRKKIANQDWNVELWIQSTKNQIRHGNIL